jgi:predicted DNA-binding protein
MYSESAYTSFYVYYAGGALMEAVLRVSRAKASTKVQINVWMPQVFVHLIDEAARFTGSTRSDVVRRALERYIAELRQSGLLSALKEG